MRALTVISTVVTPATSYDLTDLETVKDELGIGDNTDDTKLKRWISAASAAAAQFCNRVFPVETVSDQIWPRRDPWPRLVDGRPMPLQLSRWPLVAIASLTLDGTALVAGTDFIADNQLGQLTRLDADGNPKPWTASAIVAQFTAGYAAIPNEIADAVIRLVKIRYFGRDRDPMVRAENVEGVESRTYWFATGPGGTGNMPPDVTDLLDNYRVPVIA